MTYERWTQYRRIYLLTCLTPYEIVTLVKTTMFIVATAAMLLSQSAPRSESCRPFFLAALSRIQ